MLGRILLIWLFATSAAMAQSYPSPTYNTMTITSKNGLIVGNGSSPISAIAPGTGVATALSLATNSTNGIVTNVATALGYTPVNKAGDTMTGSLAMANGFNFNLIDPASATYSGLGIQKSLNVDSVFPGSSIGPNPQNSVTTTITTTSGSTSATLGSATGTRNGLSVICTCVPTNNYIVSGGGTTSIVLAYAATSTGTTTVIIGNDRWNTTSSYVANTIGATNLYVGSAASYASTFLNENNAGGLDYPVIASFVVTSPSGNVAVVGGSRLGDGSGQIPITSEMFFEADNNPNSASETWVKYSQMYMHTSQGTRAFVEENSMLTYETATTVDPFNENPLHRAVNERFDCGIGPSPLVTAKGTPSKCSALVQFTNNGVSSFAGIMVGNGALDTASGNGGVAPVIGMPSMNGFQWYSQNGSGATIPTWRLYASGSTTSPNNYIAMNDNFVQFSKTLVLGGVPTSCSGWPSGTLWNNSNVINICP